MSGPIAASELPASSSNLPMADKPRTRFVFVDGLRGLAAMAVVLVHLGPLGTLGDRLQTFVPARVLNVFSYGYLGVPVFFVLSGFVIAYSQRGVYITPRFLGNFALRRSIRLDPPYWLSILAMLMVNAVLNPMRPGREIPFPGWHVLLAHVFYLQDLLGIRQINGVCWTLCYEVQFYLVLTILTGIAQRLTLHDRPFAGVKQASRLLVFGPVALVSLFAEIGWIPVHHGLFIDRWFSFFLGVMVWNVMERSVSAKWFWGYVLIIGAVLFGLPRHGINESGGIWAITALVTGIAIYSAGALGRMDRWLAAGWVQFLGRISYSLYLFPPAVGTTLESLGARVCRRSNVLVIPWVLMSIAACVGVAFVVYTCVERPAVRLAQRFKPEKRPAG